MENVYCIRHVKPNAITNLCRGYTGDIDSIQVAFDLWYLRSARSIHTRTTYHSRATTLFYGGNRSVLLRSSIQPTSQVVQNTLSFFNPQILKAVCRRDRISRRLLSNKCVRSFDHCTIPNLFPVYLKLTSSPSSGPLREPQRAPIRSHPS